MLPASGTIPAQIAERHDSRPVRAAAPDRVDRGYWFPLRERFWQPRRPRTVDHVEPYRRTL
jgi:hypothetical protein